MDDKSFKMTIWWKNFENNIFVSTNVCSTSTNVCSAWKYVKNFRQVKIEGDEVCVYYTWFYKNSNLGTIAVVILCKKHGYKI